MLTTLNLSRTPAPIPNWREDERVIRAVATFKSVTTLPAQSKVSEGELRDAEERLAEAEVQAAYGRMTVAEVAALRKNVEELQAAVERDRVRGRQASARQVRARELATAEVRAVQKESADQWIARAEAIHAKLEPLVRQMLDLIEAQRVLDEAHVDLFGEGGAFGVRDGLGNLVQPVGYYATPGTSVPVSFRRCSGLITEVEAHLRDFLRLNAERRA